MSDTEIFGVYVNSEFITSLFALILTFALHRILVFFGLNRRVWHQALFETALFVIIWGAVLDFSTFSIS
jgi:hypothetical protein